MHFVFGKANGKEESFFPFLCWKACTIGFVREKDYLK